MEIIIIWYYLSTIMSLKFYKYNTITIVRRLFHYRYFENKILRECYNIINNFFESLYDKYYNENKSIWKCK